MNREIDPAFPARGVFYLLGAAFLFSIMSVLVKEAGRRLPAEEMVLARGVVTFFVSYALVRRAGLSPMGNRKGLLFLRGLFGFIALYCFFSALTLLPLAEVTLIHYLNPLLTAFLASVFLKERFGARLAAALFLSLTGVVLIAQPGALLRGASTLSTAGLAFALGGAFFSALAYTTVRKLRNTDHPLVIVFVFSLMAFVGSVPLVWPVFIMPQGKEWLLLLGVGLCTQWAQVLLTRGIAVVPAGPATSVGYVQIVFAALWGAVFFGEIPPALTFAGAGLIGTGLGLLFWRRSRVPTTPVPH